jgi:RNA polymerase sigma factor (sigma-70 family)
MTSVPMSINAASPAVSDAAVIAASHDDPQAFAALFERHFDPIARWLARRVGAALAEDLAAETFTRAFDRRDRYEPTFDSARPWLFGIAANLVRDQHRSEGRRLRALARAEAWEPPPSDIAALLDGRADARAAGPAIAAALAALRSEEREVLLLVAWTDLDHDEIARALGVAAGTVRSRLHRARRRVQDRLNTKEDDR